MLEFYPITEDDIQVTKGDDPERGHLHLPRPIPFLTNPTTHDLYIDTNGYVTGMPLNHFDFIEKHLPNKYVFKGLKIIRNIQKPVILTA